MRLYVYFWPKNDIDGYTDQVKMYIWKNIEDKHSIKKDKLPIMIFKRCMLRLPSTKKIYIKLQSWDNMYLLA